MSTLVRHHDRLVAMHGKLVKFPDSSFKIKIDTSKGNGFNSFQLPLTNHTTNIKVKTSDGQAFTITNYLDPAKSISFASSGVYTVEIIGVCGWSFNNTGDCQKLVGVLRWGADFKFSYLAGGFYGCINLGLNEGLPSQGYIQYFTDTTLSMQNTFRLCNLSSYGNPYFLQKLKILSLTEAFSNNNLPYICDKLLYGQTSLTGCAYAFKNNIPLVDIHDDAFKSLTNCTNITEYLRGCRLTTVKKQWHQSFSKITTATSAYYDNRITSVEAEAFDSLINVTVMAFVLYANNLASLPNRIFYNNKKATTYTSALSQQRVPMALPAEVWDLSAISIVTSWNAVLSAINTDLSPTGTVQDIWNYASQTAVKVDAFLNCTALTNYSDIPNNWKGL